MSEEKYAPSAEMIANAHVDAAKYEAMYTESVKDPSNIQIFRSNGTKTASLMFAQTALIVTRTRPQTKLQSSGRAMTPPSTNIFLMVS